MNRIKHTDGVTSIYKRAAQATAEEAQEPCRQANLGSLNAAAAVWAVYYACPTCGGSGIAPKPENCICTVFRDTGGFRIADLGCPVHGVSGSEPGDGPWRDCPAEHVKLMNPFDKSIVYADPNLVTMTCPNSWVCNNLGYERLMSDAAIKSCRRSHVAVPLPMEADNE